MSILPACEESGLGIKNANKFLIGTAITYILKKWIIWIEKSPKKSTGIIQNQKKELD